MVTCVNRITLGCHLASLSSSWQVTPQCAYPSSTWRVRPQWLRPYKLISTEADSSFEVNKELIQAFEDNKEDLRG